MEARGRVRGTLVAASRADSGPTGGLLLPERRLGTPATFGVATNGRIEIRSQVGSAPWDPRLDTEQILVIEGDLVAELTSDTLQTDRLRAGYLEVALMRSRPEPQDAPTASTARMGGMQTSPRQPRKTPPDERLVPWTVETEVLFDFGKGLPANAVRYAALMRKLAETNNGSFVGLNSVK